MNRTNTTNRYLELDALRGIAALFVVLFHFTLGRPEANLGFKLGTTGVDLFFIISGFVILMSIHHAKNAHQFVINRISRLYPTYWFAVCFGFVLVTIELYNRNNAYEIEWYRYFTNMTMFQFYFNENNIDGPYWTMIIEMLFYGFILILYITKTLEYLIFIGVGLVILSLSLAFNWFNSDWSNYFLTNIPFLQFVPLFFAGTLFYRLKTKPDRPVLLLFLIFGCLIAQIILFPFVGLSHIFIKQWEYSILLTIYFLLFTLFVWDKLSFIVSKQTLFLGKISFALYLIHQRLALTFLIPWFTEKCGLNFFVAAFLITLPICILIAALITFYIEIPSGKWIKSKLISTN